MMHKKLVCLKSASLYLILVSVLTSCAVNTKAPVALYVYHDFPPFVLSAEDATPSLSRLFLSALSQNTGERFVLVPMARAPLNKKIKQGEPVVVLWANAKWFTGFNPIFSEPIIWDSNILVTLKATEVKSNQASALVNQRFCVIKGHNYGDLEPFLAKGDIVTVESYSYDQCIELLKENKVDFIQMQRSRFYNASFKDNSDILKIIEPSRDSFSRNVLMFNGAVKHLPMINRGIMNLKHNVSWQVGLNELGDEHFIKLFDMNLHTLMDIKVE